MYSNSEGDETSGNSMYEGDGVLGGDCGIESVKLSARKLTTSFSNSARTKYSVTSLSISCCSSGVGSVRGHVPAGGDTGKYFDGRVL